MTRLSIKLAVVSFFVALLSGCFAIVIDPTEGLSVVINAATYDHSATFNFGSVEPGGEALTVTAEITNVTETEITITSAVVAGTPFAITTPTLPATIAPGETVSTTLSFEPTDSEVSTDTLTVSIDGVDLVFVLNLVGEGNFAPRAYDAVVVTGAGESDANGVYVRDGFLNTDSFLGQISYYVLPGTDYRIFGEEVEGVWWVLGTTDDSADALYHIEYRGPTGPTSGGLEDWLQDDGPLPVPNSVGPFSMVNEVHPETGESFTVNYVFDDPEGDTEGETTFRWFKSDTDDELGLYSLVDIPNPTNSYMPVAGDEHRHFMLEVTPVATDGTLVGEPVMIGPSPPVDPGAG